MLLITVLLLMVAAPCVRPVYAKKTSQEEKQKHKAGNLLHSLSNLFLVENGPKDADYFDKKLDKEFGTGYAPPLDAAAVLPRSGMKSKMTPLEAARARKRRMKHYADVPTRSRGRT